MSDTETTVPLSESTTPTTMSPKTTSNISFSIWPPSQRTRDAVTNRLIETLSTPSVLSKRYGTLSPAEAASAAKLIEDEAFSAAGGSGPVGDEDGIEVLQVYSKEISKRMLDTVKARAAAAENNDGLKGNDADDDVPVATEEVSPVED